MTGIVEQERILSRLRTAHRVAGVGSWESSLDDRGRNKALLWSPEVHEITGWSADRPPTYGDFVALIHPDDRPAFFEMRDAAIAGTRPYRMDLRLLRPDAQVRHIHLVAEVVLGPDGTAERLIGVLQDRTDEIESMRRVRTAEASRRHLLQRLLEASEHERERLARHLETGAIGALREIEVRMAAQIRAEDPEAWHDALDAIRRSIDSLTRTLSAMSTAPASADLASVVIDLAADAATDLEVGTDVQILTPLRPALRSVVVRLVQEGLQNTRKHAAARTAEVRIRSVGDAVHVEVVDDGRGFDPGAVRRRRGHFGIASLHDDVAAVGGELRIRSGPQGTALEARLPIH